MNPFQGLPIYSKEMVMLLCSSTLKVSQLLACQRNGGIGRGAPGCGHPAISQSSFVPPHHCCHCHHHRSLPLCLKHHHHCLHAWRPPLCLNHLPKCSQALIQSTRSGTEVLQKLRQALPRASQEPTRESLAGDASGFARGVSAHWDPENLTPAAGKANDFDGFGDLWIDVSEWKT